jgi:Fungal Zn(2)-Cys(6) binuclear cluster domain
MVFRDALRRHEQVHNEPKRSVLGKGYRACLACAAARRKCSGGIPCLGCQKRTVDCRYPESGRSRRATSTQLTVAGEDAASPINEHGTPSGSEHSYSKAEESPMSWSNRSTSPRMNQDQDQDQIHNRTADSLPGTNDPDTFLFESQASPEYALSFARNSVQMQSSISPGRSGVANSQLPTSPTSRGMPQSSGIPPNSEPIQPLSEQQTTVASLEMNSGTVMEHNQHENGVPEPWYQNNFTSINWLPDNWTPDFQIDGSLGPFDQQSLFFGQTSQAGNITFPLGNSNQHQQSPRPFPRARETLRRHSQAVDTQDVSSPSTQSTHSGGHYYVDGDGARLPRVRKIPYRYSDSYAHASTFNSEEMFPAFKFPEVGELPEVPENQQIPQGSYAEIIESYTHTCITSNHYAKFYDAALPSRQTLSLCVLLYRDNFESTLPFIHPATFDVSSSHWLLLLALAAVGSHYLETELSESFSIATHEFLRRAIETMVTFCVPSLCHVSSNTPS